MAIVKVKDLKGVALDWAIATSEQLPVVLDPMGFRKDEPRCSQAGYWIWFDDCKSGSCLLIGHDGYSPSTKWHQGGDIIDRHNISLIAPTESAPEPRQWKAELPNGKAQHVGNTALVAAMKAYVTSVLGDEINLPDLLLAR